MSIVDAIQRAKQLGRVRATETAPQSVVESAVGGDVFNNDTIHRADRPAVVEPSVVLEPVEFEKLPYDLDACIQNHIMVPDVEAQMAQAASSPYRMLRARILQSCRANRWSCLAVTSPGPGEGKSVTSLNLAISIAREGNYDVFLLDLDMRNPSACRYLGVSAKHDIRDFFAGECAARDVFFTVGIDRLSIAGGTMGTPHASELLATNNLEQLLAFIRRVSANPLIIIDLPPVVSTDDALVVAPRVDATVLVVSEGHTRRDGLERALGLLSEYKIAGIVLNQTSESIGAQYYGA